MVILGGSWMGTYHKGFGWDISTVFNYHPLFMTIGMIYLYGDGKTNTFIFACLFEIYDIMKLRKKPC